MIFKEMGGINSFKLEHSVMIRFVFWKSNLTTLGSMDCKEEIQRHVNQLTDCCNSPSEKQLSSVLG